MRRRKLEADEALAPDPLWYKSAIIYELHVRAFADSNDDGIGDFAGLVERLDYVQDLGVTALWLLPFYPSPLRDGGYDISDYTSINPAYGTLKDFARLLKEAHRRGIRVITELVLNHTSSEHDWFQRARRAAPGSKARDLYVWSDSPKRYADARIIFKDFETSNWSWDPVAKAYYWHRFYSHQPDLNFDNPEVHKALLRVIDFWLDLGVDGMRLDAVPYLYEREGTNCENLPETHSFLKKLRAHVDSKYRDRLLLAEANQWPQDAAAYFGEGDECHMNFHFPLMPRMFMAVHLEDRFPIVDILEQTPAIPPSCQWATFLRNHDELTLEMVTDEDRDYMYRVYAEDPTARINLGIRRRLAPLVKGRRRIELMNAMLMSLPGTPVLYYGDEIGMGDNIYLGDRDGVRTPMQWSADRNAGFSRANPQKLYLPVITDPEYHYESNNVQAQQGNASSLLWWQKRLIALRKENQALANGNIEFLSPENHKILAFVRANDKERVLVVINLSRYAQAAELDLAKLAGLVPVEMFGRTPFPPITEKPYFLSVGPHGFYWFRLEPPPQPRGDGAREPPKIEVGGAWTSVFAGRARARLAAALFDYAARARWYRGKARVHKDARITDVVPLDGARGDHALAFLEVEYQDGEPDTYVIALSYLEAARGLPVLCELGGARRGVLVDGLFAGAPALLLDAIRKKRGAQGQAGELLASHGRAFREVAGDGALEPRAVALEQTNSTVFFGDKLLLKLYRQVEPGTNPELEIGAFLTERTRGMAPRMLAAVEYRRPAYGEPATVATVQELLPNVGVAWDTVQQALDRYFERILQERPSAPLSPAGTLLAQADAELPAEMREHLGAFLLRARRLGEETAELHLALAAGSDRPAFASEPFTSFYQQSLFQAAHKMWLRTLELLRRRLSRLPGALAERAAAIIAEEDRVDERLRAVTRGKITLDRIRVHGDLHLGQILDTGSDFVIIDFEGEPGRPLHERRYKRCPLVDVAGMMRSLCYAGEAALRSGRQRPEDAAQLLPWARAWSKWMSATYLHEYLRVAGAASFLPADAATRELLLGFYQLEKCVYEIRYELNNRPEWLDIPLAGLQELMSAV